MGLSKADADRMIIGVLALQGSFREHCNHLRKAGADAKEIRVPADLEGCRGLIIPGGESTTMALLARSNGLMPALQDFQSGGRCIWGTCAGMIFIANSAEGQKEGGQELLGGLNCTVHRNFFGSQINSFETHIDAPAEIRRLDLEGNEDGKFRAIFIRAPAILEVAHDVQVLAEYILPEKRADDRKSVIIAARHGHLLATSFHPELTSDTRWHRRFLEMVQDSKATEYASQSELPDRLSVSVPSDMPVFER